MKFCLEEVYQSTLKQKSLHVLEIKHMSETKEFIKVAHVIQCKIRRLKTLRNSAPQDQKRLQSQMIQNKILALTHSDFRILSKLLSFSKCSAFNYKMGDNNVIYFRELP